jgi:hypothetical protein
MRVENVDALKQIIKDRLGARDMMSVCEIGHHYNGYAYSFFCALGLEEFNIITVGNDITVPCVDDLIKAQYGYSWNPKKQQQITGWPSGLFVVAFSGEVAFAVNDKNHEVSLVSLDCNNLWCTEYLFSDLFEMFYGFAVIGGVAREAKNNFTDMNGVKREYIDQAKVELHQYGFSQERIAHILGSLGWIPKL